MTDSNSTPTHEQIARRAYEIFTERGQPTGQDLAHWLEAERQLHAAGKVGNDAQVASSQLRAARPAPPSDGRSQGNGRTQRATVRK